jgi:hypothetical protein
VEELLQVIHKIPYLSGYTEGRNGSSGGGNLLQLEYWLFHRDCMPILGINHFTGENTRDERRSAYVLTSHHRFTRLLKPPSIADWMVG